MVRPTIHSNSSWKGSFSETLLRPEETLQTLAFQKDTTYIKRLFKKQSYEQHKLKFVQVPAVKDL